MNRNISWALVSATCLLCSQNLFAADAEEEAKKAAERAVNKAVASLLAKSVEQSISDTKKSDQAKSSSGNSVYLQPSYGWMPKFNVAGTEIDSNMTSVLTGGVFSAGSRAMFGIAANYASLKTTVKTPAMNVLGFVTPASTVKSSTNMSLVKGTGTAIFSRSSDSNSASAFWATVGGQAGWSSSTADSSSYGVDINLTGSYTDKKSNFQILGSYGLANTTSKVDVNVGGQTSTTTSNSSAYNFGLQGKYLGNPVELSLALDYGGVFAEDGASLTVTPSLDYNINSSSQIGIGYSNSRTVNNPDNTPSIIFHSIFANYKLSF
ncbi:MAG: hypothetical protein HQL65_20265 [Magnetococcales bacterium]|nr:hypothetical protein [Magnetococcales bacterium]